MPSPRARDLVTIRTGDLERLGRRHRELSVDFGGAMQGALNEVATSSTKRMAAFVVDLDAAGEDCRGKVDAIRRIVAEDAKGTG